MNEPTDPKAAQRILMAELVKRGLLPDPMAVENQMSLGMTVAFNPYEDIVRDLVSMLITRASHLTALEEQLDSQRRTIVKYDRALIRLQSFVRYVHDAHCNAEMDGDAPPDTNDLFGSSLNPVVRYMLADIE